MDAEAGERLSEVVDGWMMLMVDVRRNVWKKGGWLDGQMSGLKEGG